MANRDQAEADQVLCGQIWQYLVVNIVRLERLDILLQPEVA